jgi:hypothetical protein
MISVSFGSAPSRSIAQRSVPLSQDLRSFLQPHHLKLCERFDQFHLRGHARIEANLGCARDAGAAETMREHILVSLPTVLRYYVEHIGESAYPSDGFQHHVAPLD